VPRGRENVARKLELARRWWNGKEVYDPVHNNAFFSFSFCLNAAIYMPSVFTVHGIVD